MELEWIPEHNLFHGDWWTPPLTSATAISVKAQTQTHQASQLEVSSLLPSMSSSLIMHRLHHAVRLPFLYPCQSVYSGTSQRRAMMSALSHSQDPRIHAQSSSSSRQSNSTELPDSPPLVAPSADLLSPDSSSPQTAARPPPIPKAEKPRPTLKSTKAALSIVRSFVSR